MRDLAGSFNDVAAAYERGRPRYEAHVVAAIAAAAGGAVCCDAWHWFDGARAADELQRVLRPGGGVVVCVTYPRWQVGDDAPAWWAELAEIYDALPKDDHPSVSGSLRPDGLEGHPGFESMELRNVPFVHFTDREGMLAHYTSMSFVASLPPARRAEVLGALEGALVRHGVDRVEIPYRAELWITRRRPDPGRRAGRRAAMS